MISSTIAAYAAISDQSLLTGLFHTTLKKFLKVQSATPSWLQAIAISMPFHGALQAAPNTDITKCCRPLDHQNVDHQVHDRSLFLPHLFCFRYWTVLRKLSG